MIKEITQDIVLEDGRHSIVELWTDENENTLNYSYVCDSTEEAVQRMESRSDRVVIDFQNAYYTPYEEGST